MRSNQILCLLFLSAYLTGCYTQLYTQLYTRGYGERARDSEPRSTNRFQPAADTLSSPDSSALAKSNVLPQTDSNSQPIVINNYYNRDNPYGREDSYRGYSNFDWDYPILSFSFYSSRYRSYSDPYWWHGGGSYRDRYYGHYHDSWYNYSNQGSTNHSPSSHSNQRLFTPPPSYPEIRKGQRSRESVPPAPRSPVPTPKYSPSPEPAPVQVSPQSSPPPERSNSGQNSNSNPVPSDSHPKLEKGKRR